MEPQICDAIQFDQEFEPDVVFVTAGQRSVPAALPYAEGLVQVANEHFAFMTAPSADQGEARLKALETSMADLAASMQLLLKAQGIKPGERARPRLLQKAWSKPLQSGLLLQLLVRGPFLEPRARRAPASTLVLFRLRRFLAYRRPNFMRFGTSFSEVQAPCPSISMPDYPQEAMLDVISGQPFQTPIEAGSLPGLEGQQPEPQRRPGGPSGRPAATLLSGSTSEPALFLLWASRASVLLSPQPLLLPSALRLFLKACQSSRRAST